MKVRSLLALAALVTLAIAPVAPAFAQGGKAAPALALGSTMPMADAKLKNVDGKDVTLASLKGAKGTLVVFTCNACPWAKKWESRVASIGNDAVKRGFGVVAINSNDPGKNPEDGYDVMKARAKTRGMKFPYAVDGTSELARAFGANKTPEVFLFDAAGKLVYHGAIDDNADDAKAVKASYLQDAVAAVAAGKKVTNAQTKALGCTIKFRAKSAT
jgi:cytochrome oxidase Cu insertion factor (SCO1/SenC/PrrC family)